MLKINVCLIRCRPRLFEFDEGGGGIKYMVFNSFFSQANLVLYIYKPIAYIHPILGPISLGLNYM